MEQVRVAGWSVYGKLQRGDIKGGGILARLTNRILAEGRSE